MSFAKQITNELTFDIAQELINQGVCGVYLAIYGLHNRENDADYKNYKQTRLDVIYQSLPQDFQTSDPILAGYRDLHTHFGFSNRNFPAAPETLLENLKKFHRLAHINLLVDIYNLISLETHLALGAHDLAYVNGNIHLRPMTGEEHFWPLGSTEEKRARPGGYSYIDDANDILCMLDSRQVEKTKVTETTTDVFYIIQGNANTPLELLVTGATLLTELTQRFCGGTVDWLYPKK